MLRRTVTLDKKPTKKRRTMPRKVPMGLRRYLDNRGTPRGTYEIVRTATGYFDHVPGGITIGAGNYEAGTWVITPQTVELQSGIVGNTYTMTIPNASELSALWDKLKIDKVEFTFSSGTIGTANNGAAAPPAFLFAFDPNDRAASLDTVRQMDCQVWQEGQNAREFKTTIKPCYQRVIYYTAASSSYEPARGYVVSDTAIPHYGLKMAISQFSAASNGGRVHVFVKLFFKLKDLK